MQSCNSTAKLHKIISLAKKIILLPLLFTDADYKAATGSHPTLHYSVYNFDNIQHFYIRYDIISH